jgi:hypothetical protein
MLQNNSLIIYRTEKEIRKHVVKHKLFGVVRAQGIMYKI